MQHLPHGKTLDADEYAFRHEDLGFEAYLIRARQNCNLRLLASNTISRVLEVGCGPRLLVERAVAAGIPFDSWTIIEPASAYYAAAATYAGSEHRLSVFKGYLESAINVLGSSAPAGYDTVLLSGVLNETAHPEEMLRAALSLMSSGGLIHVNVANGQSFHRLLAVKMNLIGDPTALSERNKHFGQPVVFTPRSLRDLVERVGCVDLELQGCFFKPFTNDQLAVITSLFGEGVVAGMEELGRDIPEHAAEVCISARKA
jgi:hypothetical protein